MNGTFSNVAVRTLAGLVLMAGLLWEDAKVASAEQAEHAGIEEILVTARKREENVRQVPISVTAISEETVEMARLDQVADVVALTPGVTLREQFSPSFTNLTVRGIATQQNGELPVALSIDGVTVPFTSFLNQDLLDVQQVEVLKGPQGGLYGRNAIAGAINITTRSPSDVFEGRFRATYGNGDYKQVTGTISGPVADRGLYGKIGFSVKDSNGLIDNQLHSDNLDFVEEKTVFGRLVYYGAGERFALDLRGRYTNADVGASYFAELPAERLDDFSGDTDPVISDPAGDDRELFEITAKIDFETEAGSFASITGFYDVEDFIYGDADFGIPAWGAEFGIFQDFRTTVEGWSQEFRFTSPADRGFRWIAGAFYQDRRNSTFTDILTDIGAGFPESVFLVEDSTNDSESWALFGQADYDLTPSVEFSLALRYDEDKRSTVDRAVPGERQNRSFSEFQPKLTLSYSLGDDFLVYGSWGKGFRSGGFNGFGVPAENRSFDKEVSTTWELGIKSSLADGRIQADASVYHMKYDDQQFFFFIDVFNSLIVNAEETTIDGAELELTMRLAGGLDLYANFGFTDGEITKDDNPPDANFGSFIGNSSPGSHRYSLGLGAQYVHAVAGTGFEWATRVDFERRGPIYYEFNNRDRTGPVDLLNVRTAVRNDAWSFSAFVRNLTDERYPLTAETLVPDLGPGRVFRLPSRPRFFGLEVAYRF